MIGAMRRPLAFRDLGMGSKKGFEFCRACLYNMYMKEKKHLSVDFSSGFNATAPALKKQMLKEEK